MRWGAENCETRVWPEGAESFKVAEAARGMSQLARKRSFFFHPRAPGVRLGKDMLERKESRTPLQGPGGDARCAGIFVNGGVGR
jgi:hypothetical protein